MPRSCAAPHVAHRSVAHPILPSLHLILWRTSAADTCRNVAATTAERCDQRRGKSGAAFALRKRRDAFDTSVCIALLYGAIAVLRVLFMGQKLTLSFVSKPVVHVATRQRNFRAHLNIENSDSFETQSGVKALCV
jgi:hypothetical protein